MLTTATAIFAAKALTGIAGHALIKHTCSDKNGKLTKGGCVLSAILTTGLVMSGDIKSLITATTAAAAASAAA